MEYLSTRDSSSQTFSFEQVLMEGLARDGGLYLPKKWKVPYGNNSSLTALSYADLAARIMEPYTAPSMNENILQKLAKNAYRNFDHSSVAPLTEISDGLWLMDLFHGPTLAFKDFALQFVGLLFDAVLKKRGNHLTILGATSGDTGSAAIEAFRGYSNISIFILYPEGRVSEVQRRQMTSVMDPNVHTLAIDGSFDDCQAIVKDLFNDLSFRDEMKLGAINSINWGRILAQTVYYWHASLVLNSSKNGISFSVPTGNFGNIFAGWVASQSGLLVNKLLVATNKNDILARFFNSGIYEKRSVISTISPSMDIQIASNFERLLYHMVGLSGAQVTSKMNALDKKHEFSLGKKEGKYERDMFFGKSINDQQALKTIAHVYKNSGLLIDPHTATAVAAATGLDSFIQKDHPTVCLSTAHPAKFPDAVEKATGVRPKLPDRLASLFELEERIVCLPNELSRIKSYLLGYAKNNHHS